MTLVLSASFALAQTASVTGQVVDADTGGPLPGANVIIPDLSIGAVTSPDGRYTIQDVPVRQAPYLVQASFAGYQQASQSVTLQQAGQAATANFRLSPGVELREVIVTALGIERQERELGYSVTQIRGDELEAGLGTQLIQNMSGRISGVDVLESSGNIGASTRIILRGVTSLAGDNQPLFVVDGVPISNSNVAPGQGRLQGSVDTGNRANDINPADIESISVLKGGAAAALYGQRAKNGVILITTRRGVDRPRAAVQVSSSLLSSTVSRFPNFQNEYGPGGTGTYAWDPTGVRAVQTAGTTSGWGPRMTGQMVPGTLVQPDTPQPLVAQPNNVSEFFETGVTSTNNVSLSTGSQAMDFRLGLGHVSQGGIVPGSRLDRTTLSAQAGARFGNRFNARSSINYVTSDDVGRAVQGGNDPNILTSIAFGFPRNLDINQLREYIDPNTQQQRPMGPLTNNPYWIVNENPFTSDLQRVYGTGTIGYEPLEWLSVTARVGTDFYTNNRRQINRVGTIGRLSGQFRDDIIQEQEINSDIIVQANRRLTDEFTLTALVGNNINQREFRRNLVNAENIVADGVYNYAAALSTQPTNSSSLRRLFGFYADATIGWRDVVFLNLTGRNDWTSTLPVENRSYFYPSAALSVVFSDLINLDPTVLSYGKLRLNAARVGSDTAPYQTSFRYFPVSNVFGQFNTAINFPYFNQGGFNASAVIPNFNLRPQQQTTYEIGTELGFFYDRFSLDLNYYDQVTDDQILNLPTPQSTGFSFRQENVGAISNRGFEATLNARTFEFGQFSHDFRTTFSTNRNRVVELAEGVNEVVIESGYNSLQVRAEPGEALGLYGVGWQRDEETGLPIINALTGLRERTTTAIRLGDIDPNFRLGFSNTFRYGPVGLSFLIDWKDGGVLYSNTVSSARIAGLAEETTANREGTFIDRGVICTGTGANRTCRPNDVPVVNMQSFWANFAAGQAQESSTFDASYVKLREVVLSFDLPATILQRTPFGSAALSIEGRNLALLFSRIPHIDPETNLFGSGTVGGAGYEFNNIPSTRTFGVNLSVTF
jgi:TonB-linked SusC/RagA family outer membrane protein